MAKMRGKEKKQEEDERKQQTKHEDRHDEQVRAEVQEGADREESPHIALMRKRNNEGGARRESVG